MSYTIEFQPGGIRLVLDEPTLLLDAIRQASINIRADCGGKGICGKCLVQLLDSKENIPFTGIENSHLGDDKLESGFRLACEIVIRSDIRIYIPQESIITNQVLQVEGQAIDIQPQPAIQQKTIRVPEPTLSDLASDSSRIKNMPGISGVSIRMDAMRLLPDLLRKNDWSCNLLLRDQEIFHVSESAYRPLLGLAVDVGSTKLACYLMDLNTGKTLAAKGTPNPQIRYGEDIMTRLGYAVHKNENTRELHNVLMRAINQAAFDLASHIGRDQSDISDVCLVGNTAMHHFLLGLPARSLAFSPFVPALSETRYPLAKKIDVDAMPGARVYSPPVIAGFVGSDHLAFLLSTGFSKDDKVRLGIDIGTNTEIGLQVGERIMSVSTASGPAFEGAHIRFGMRAAPGAIEHIRISQGGAPEIDVIGSVDPVGICGSGILDALSEMRSVGILNKRGRLDKNSPFVQHGPDGKLYYPLSGGDKPVTLSQKDIDQVLLAKGAIRAGIDVLMDAMKIESADIEEVLIAGAFGSYMHPRHAIGIGMLPPVDLERIHTVGNAAGAGARMMLLSRLARKEAEALASRIQYLELTVYPDFPLFYARGIQA
jgi:uncharacterized 2Fe-2S/4Fe-4S cluster protein (DUF4445 family)